LRSRRRTSVEVFVCGSIGSKWIKKPRNKLIKPKKKKCRNARKWRTKTNKQLMEWVTIATKYFKIHELSLEPKSMVLFMSSFLHVMICV